MSEMVTGGNAAPSGSTPRTEPRNKSLYIPAIGEAVLLVGGLMAILILGQYSRTLSTWHGRESSLADFRHEQVTDWLDNRSTDAKLVAMSAVVVDTLTRGASGQIVPSAKAHLGKILNNYIHIRSKNYETAYVFDAEGHEIARSQGALDLGPLSTHMLNDCARTRSPRIDLLGTPERNLLAFSAPIVRESVATGTPSGPPKTLGVVVLVCDLDRTLIPLLSHESVPTRTGETVLMRQRGKDVIFITPLRNLPNHRKRFRQLAQSATIAARAALNGRKTFASFTDYRGARVLAATRQIDATGWGLVSKIDRAEALQGLKREAAIEVAAAFLVLLTFAGRLTAHRRQVVVRVQQRTEEELRRLNRALRTISECNQVLVRMNNETDLLNSVCQILVDHGGFRLAWVGYAEKNQSKGVLPVASAGAENGYLSKAGITWADDERGKGPVGSAIRTAQPVVVRNTESESSFALWREEALRRGYASVIAAPLMAQGKAFGALAVYSGQQDAFDTAEVELLNELANDLAYGIGALRNQDERKRAEEKLARLKKAVDGSNEVVFMTDAQGVITLINPAFSRTYGYTEEEVVGKMTPRLLKGGQVKPETYEAFWEMLLEKRAVRGEFINKAKDGRLVTVDASASAILDERGEITGFLGIQRDISERKKLEAAMRASEIRYRRLFEAAKDGILILDHDTGIIVDVNPFMENLLGYPSREMLGKKLWEIGPFKEVDTSKISFRELRDQGSIRYEDLPLQTSDGRLAAVEFVSNVYEVNGDKVIQCNIRDITERIEAEKELKKSQEQFLQAQKMEAVGRLAGGVAHDFNNLLTVINGYSELMLENAPRDSRERSHLEEIKRAGGRAAELTRQLLAFSRKQVSMPRVLDLNTVVKGAQKMLRRMVGEDIEFVANFQKPLGKVKADPGQIEQVIMNLVVNARDAMPQGGKLTIETANAELDETYASAHADVTPGHYVMLTLSDTGCGMDPEAQSHIFEPFYTTKEQGKGTGLGLSTVYGIVKQSGGHVGVYSETGKGTTFRVYIPRTDEGIELESGKSPENGSLRRGNHPGC
jgi:PAS domain S-box-containing protein